MKQKKFLSEHFSSKHLNILKMCIQTTKTTDIHFDLEIKKLKTEIKQTNKKEQAKQARVDLIPERKRIKRKIISEITTKY